MAEAWRLFLQGGYVMWPLLIALIISFMILIERITYYHTLRVESFSLNNAISASNEEWSTLVKNLGSANTPHISYDMQSVLGEAPNRDVLQARMEDLVASLSVQLNRGLDWLSTIVTMAPLLGLLGTVTGMIGAFQIFGNEAGNPTAITGGVGEALVATAFGLCVAIVALTFHSIFAYHAKMMIIRVEDACSRMVHIYDRGH